MNEKMPSDPSIFAETKSRLDRAIEWGASILKAGHVTEPCLSEHKRTEE